MYYLLYTYTMDDMISVTDTDIKCQTEMLPNKKPKMPNKYAKSLWSTVPSSDLDYGEHMLEGIS